MSDTRVNAGSRQVATAPGSDSGSAPGSTPGAGLPGREVLGAIRRLIVVSGLIGVAYSIATTMSRSRCVGAVALEPGGYLDASGEPTDVAPQCLNLTMHASPALLLILGVLVFVSIGVVQRRAIDVVDALRILRRYTIAIAIVAGAAAIIGHAWFWLLPIGDWTGHGYSFVFPFPFASVDVNVTPADDPDGS